MDLPEKFEDLPAHERRRVRLAGTEMGRLAFRHCAGILIAPPPGSGDGRVNNGSGFVLRLDGRYFLGTAWHVIDAWLTRTASGEHLLFQVGHADLPPRGRLVWKDEADDLAFLRIDESDVRRIGIDPCEALCGWPPSKPAVGDALLVAGYPGSQRQHLDSDIIDFGSFAALLSVTSAGERYLMCQFQREHWIANEGVELPPPGADLGGMSGGPALLVQDLACPLVGVVAQHSRLFEIMRITTLAHLPRELGAV